MRENKFHRHVSSEIIRRDKKYILNYYLFLGPFSYKYSRTISWFSPSAMAMNKPGSCQHT